LGLSQTSVEVPPQWWVSTDSNGV